MKAASGELNLTVITVIAIGAVAAFFIGVLWPQIQGRIGDQVTNIGGHYCDDKGNCT